MDPLANRPGLRSVLIGATGLLLGAGIYAATLRGAADVEYTKARLLVPLPRLQLPAAKPAAVQAAQPLLREALRLDPENPHYVEQFARAHELKALALDRADPAARHALRQAAAAFRLAARMRPGSPYVWADLARVKLRMDEIDYEFYGALERANRFGPWEPAVQTATVDMGFAAWPILAVPAQEWVLAAMERALPGQTPELRRITSAYKSLPVVCQRLDLPQKVAEFCVKK